MDNPSGPGICNSELTSPWGYAQQESDFSDLGGQEGKNFPPAPGSGHPPPPIIFRRSLVAPERYRSETGIVWSFPILKSVPEADWQHFPVRHHINELEEPRKDKSISRKNKGRHFLSNICHESQPKRKTESRHRCRGEGQGCHGGGDQSGVASGWVEWEVGLP